jgi:hypothetical protein
MNYENQTSLLTAYYIQSPFDSNMHICTNRPAGFLYISDPNTFTSLQQFEIFRNILPTDQLTDVIKSHFQLAKMQKIYINKRIRYK